MYTVKNCLQKYSGNHVSKRKRQIRGSQYGNLLGHTDQLPGGHIRCRNIIISNFIRTIVLQNLRDCSSKSFFDSLILRRPRQAVTTHVLSNIWRLQKDSFVKEEIFTNFISRNIWKANQVSIADFNRRLHSIGEGHFVQKQVSWTGMVWEGKVWKQSNEIGRLRSR